MYDMHYDLLTILYFNLKRGNKFANKDKLINDCNKIYKNNNIIGGIINLYFMSPKEMIDELDIKEKEVQDVSMMLRRSISCLEIFMNSGIIDSNVDFIYSIEGCDYLNSEQDLDELYEIGVRSILPVWNEKNKFGSGIRGDGGLTNDGVKLIKKAINLGMIVDVSHANVQTFNDILDIVENEKSKGKIVNVIASHSNVKLLCDRKRNLNDEQLFRLKNVGGYIGLFTNGNFLSLDNENIDYAKRQENFIKHLDYIINKIGFDTSKIFVSTDDMNFNPDKSYHNLGAFPIENISSELKKLLISKYNTKVADDILVNNSRKLINGIKYNNIKYNRKI